VGTASLQCFATPLLRDLAHEAAAAKGVSTSSLIRLALIEYVARLGLRDGLAEELRTEALSRRIFRTAQAPDPSELYAASSTSAK
jgi:hypothetical protein